MNARANRSRRLRGSSLVLVIAIFGGFALLIMLFFLKFAGYMGSYHEQRSAIEAAALAAAKDLSEIVIDDPNFGLVGISDCSPTGNTTAAGDGFYSSVTGINTLFGTIRLDLIIADYMQDPIMRQLALTDYNNALLAQQNLVKAINSAVTTGGTIIDVNGNVLTPTQDAIDAYNSNKVHLSISENSSLVAGSLHMSVGYLNGLGTRTPVPAPQSVAALSSSQQSQGFYVANTLINYTTTQSGLTSQQMPLVTPFVFAALGPDTTLVDFREFQASIGGLPYSTPTVIKLEADELSSDGVLNHTVHAVAAALCGTVVDQRPYPGAFTLTLTDGPVPEISQLTDLFNNIQIQSDPTDIMQTPLTGDYPQTGLSNYAMPFLSTPDPYHPKLENVISVVFYDWIRRAGTNVNVQSLVSAVQSPMNFGAGGAQQQRFHITASGTVVNDSIPWGKTNCTVSNNQFRAISGLGIDSSDQSMYDIQITDFVRLPGRSKGGLHAGEPLNVPGQMGSNSAPYIGSTMFENTTWPYQEYLLGSGIRPTYNSDGISVDFTVRMRH